MNKQQKLKNIGTVAVALSGGIDSTTAAFLLKKSGFDIFGVTLKLVSDKNFKKNAELVDKICSELNIKKYIIDLTEAFEEKIIKTFCTVYLEGRTPNPCIECNKLIKFGMLLEKIIDLGASHLATGHYAIIEKSQDNDGRCLYRLKKGVDKTKDQSYFLWKLNQKELEKIIFPLGKLYKREVTKISIKTFPFLKGRPESQEICFLKGTSYKDFIIESLKIRSLKINGLKMDKKIGCGQVTDSAGRVLGTHKGYPFYTIGQRRGLGISHSKPLYVKAIIPEENKIVAGEEEEIFTRQFYIQDLNFISGKPPAKNFDADVKIRYNSEQQHAKIQIISDNRALVKFNSSQKAITPGQSAVFYRRDILLGGGIITETFSVS